MGLVERPRHIPLAVNFQFGDFPHFLRGNGQRHVLDRAGGKEKVDDLLPIGRHRTDYIDCPLVSRRPCHPLAAGAVGEESIEYFLPVGRSRSNGSGGTALYDLDGKLLDIPSRILGRGIEANPVYGEVPSQIEQEGSG